MGKNGQNGGWKMEDTLGGTMLGDSKVKFVTRGERE